MCYLLFQEMIVSSYYYIFTYTQFKFISHLKKKKDTVAGDFNICCMLQDYLGDFENKLEQTET